MDSQWQIGISLTRVLVCYIEVMTMKSALVVVLDIGKIDMTRNGNAANNIALPLTNLVLVDQIWDYLFFLDIQEEG